MNSLNDAREFIDPGTASSSGLSHVFSQLVRIPSRRGMISRDSCLQPDTRNSFGISGNVFFWTYVLRVNLQQFSSENPEVWHQHHASLCLFIRRDLPIERKNWTKTLAFLQFLHRELQVFNLESSFSCRAYPRNCMVELSRNQVSELHGRCVVDQRS